MRPARFEVDPRRSSGMKWTMRNINIRGSVALPVRATVALLLSASLAACAVGPNYKKPQTPVASSFAEADAGIYSGNEAQAQFWKQFNDPTLDKLVDDSLVANHDLRIALGHLMEARAARHQSLYDLGPTVTASGGHTTEQLPAVQAGFPFKTSFYDAGFDAFWELDLFGRVRRNTEATLADLQGAEANLRDVQVSVIAEVARTYFELRGEQNELAVAQRNVQNQQDNQTPTTARLEA